MKRLLGLFIIAATLPVTADQTGRAPDANREVQYEWVFGSWQKDPYRWMENRDTPELYTWIKSQNQHTRSVLSGELYNEMRSEFNRIYGNEAESLPEEDLLMTEMLNNRKAPFSGNRNLRSPNGKYVIDNKGNDNGDFTVLRILDVENDKYLDDMLLVKFEDVIWEDGDASFLYQTDSDGRHGNAYPSVYRHIVGTSQVEDVLIAEASRPDVWISLIRVGNRYIFEESSETGTTISELDLATGARRRIISDLKNRYQPIDYLDNEIIAISDHSQDMGELISISLEHGTMKTLIAATGLHLNAALKNGSEYLVAYVRDAAHEVTWFDLDNNVSRKISLPGIGRVRLSMNNGTFRVLYNSYTENRSEWTVDTAAGTTTLLTAAKPTEIEVEAERIFYTAHNGMQVPVWIVKKKGLPLSPETPAYLYGYGGFSVNILPSLGAEIMPWLKRGGIYAVATLPGGLEYGEAWHKAGARHNKLNVFKDFAEAAKTLVTAGLTSHQKLVISGVSNGGTLVGSTLSLYPDLFKAAVPHVGVMDMTMFQDNTGGKWWKDEYGDAAQRADHNYMLRYSPYHIIPNRQLPHTLVMTGDMDDRVVPSHSYKFAAKLQSQKNNPSKAMLYTQRRASHSPYSGGTRSVVEGMALKWTFIIKATSGQLDHN